MSSGCIDLTEIDFAPIICSKVSIDVFAKIANAVEKGAEFSLIWIEIYRQGMRQPVLLRQPALRLRP